MVMPVPRATSPVGLLGPFKLLNVPSPSGGPASTQSTRRVQTTSSSPPRRRATRPEDNSPRRRSGRGRNVSLVGDGPVGLVWGLDGLRRGRRPSGGGQRARRAHFGRCVCTRGAARPGAVGNHVGRRRGRSSPWNPWSPSGRRRPRGAGAGPRPRGKCDGAPAIFMRRRGAAFVGHEALLAGNWRGTPAIPGAMSHENRSPAIQRRGDGEYDSSKIRVAARIASRDPGENGQRRLHQMRGPSK